MDIIIKYYQGFFTFSLFEYLLLSLIFTHITIISVTLYLHRCMAHKSIEINSSLSVLFRVWLWASTGMSTKQWVGVHRKHHAHCEKENDPHSPAVHGLFKVLFSGADLYRTATKNKSEIEKYTQDIKNDKLEIFIEKNQNIGIILFLTLLIVFFGIPGIIIWSIQMMWIPFFAAGVINGLAHQKGYRNFDTADYSHNLCSLGVIIGGEEMHNHHHACPTSAKFSNKWWEFDIGWLYIRLFSYLKLIKIKKNMPKLIFSKNFENNSKDIFCNQIVISTRYIKDVFLPIFRYECKTGCDIQLKKFKKEIKKFIKNENLFKKNDLIKIENLFERNKNLKKVYFFKKSLISLWSLKFQTYECFMVELNKWCEQAETSGLKALEAFALDLKKIKIVH